MVWILLVLAGLFEIVWAVGLKYTEGFTRLWPTVGTVAAMIVSFGLLAQVLKTLPIGTAYAIWTGAGAIGVIIGGVLLFGDKVSGIQACFMALTVVGIVGTKIFAQA